MAKRSIEGYRPVGLGPALAPGYRFADKALVAKLIDYAGPLPTRRFETVMVTRKGQMRERLLSARAKFIQSVERACAEYHLETESRTKPTTLQLAKQFDAIEKAAARLLATLRAGPSGDIDKVPYALRFGGLQAQAAINHKPRPAKRVQAWSAKVEREPDAVKRLRALRDIMENPEPAHEDPEGQFLPYELPQTRVRVAIRGVASLRRWAGGARERELRTHDRQERESQSPRSRKAHHEGNIALNGYLKRVFTDCWWTICQMPITDSPKPVAFCRLACAVVGIRVDDEDAARGRLRSALGLRGKSKQKKI